MKPDPQLDLAAVFQRTAGGGSSRDCPPADRFWAAASGELSFAEMRTLVDHTSACGDCSEALRLAHEVRAAAPLPVLRAAEVHPRRATWVAGLALAAGVAGLLVVSARHERQDASPFLERGAGDTAIHSALSNAPQPRGSLVLRWTAYPGARRYNVTLATADLRVLFQRSGVEQNEVSVPEAALADISPGSRLVWRVEAALDDGRSVESSAFLLDIH